MISITSSSFRRVGALSARRTDTLFSFTATRTSFRFKAGQCVLIGLEGDGKPLLRAYSMMSAPREEQLEFYSIKVANGPHTSRLQKATGCRWGAGSWALLEK